MASPVEQFIIVNKFGERVDLDELVQTLKNEEKRVLVNDEVGLVLYVGDLDLYNLKPTESGEFLAQRITEIRRPRFAKKMLRKQIGATVLSVTEDSIFVVGDGNVLKKVRAEKLTPGMILASGEKVFK